MLTNADATLYHRTYNTETDEETWHMTHLIGVHWEDKKQVIVGAGLESADVGRVFIPQSPGKKYIKPRIRPPDYETGEYTVDNGDIIVRGVIGYVIDQYNSVAKLQSTYDDVMTVTGVRDCLYGSEYMQHIELEVK